MNKLAREGKLEETGEKAGNLSRKEWDCRQKKWGDEIENIRQGTKKVKTASARR